MLNKKEVYKLIGNRIWIYQTTAQDDPFPILMSLGGSVPAFFCIVFHANGQISIPTDVGFFPPEYRYWDFDEETQEILFKSKPDEISLRAQLPSKLSYGVTAIKINHLPEHGDTNFMLINEPHEDHSEITERLLGGKKVLCVPFNAFDNGLFYKLRWSGFNIHRVPNNPELIEFLAGVYDYLAIHPKLEQVVVAYKNTEVIKVAQSNKLQFLNVHDKPSFTYFSGSRPLLMELLITVLIENNIRLIDDNDHHSEDELLQRILTDKFSNRYELIDLPGF